jgi:hypothetical protein
MAREYDVGDGSCNVRFREAGKAVFVTEMAALLQPFHVPAVGDCSGRQV